MSGRVPRFGPQTTLDQINQCTHADKAMRVGCVACCGAGPGWVPPVEVPGVEPVCALLLGGRVLDVAAAKMHTQQRETRHARAVAERAQAPPLLELLLRRRQREVGRRARQVAAGNQLEHGIPAAAARL